MNHTATTQLAWDSSIIDTSKVKKDLVQACMLIKAVGSGLYFLISHAVSCQGHDGEDVVEDDGPHVRRL